REVPDQRKRRVCPARSRNSSRYPQFILGQHSAQQSSRARYPRHHRPDRQSHRVRNILVSHLFHIAQQQHFPEVNRQTPQRNLDPFVQSGVEQNALRRLRVPRKQHLFSFFFDRYVHQRLRSGSQKGVSQNAEHPCAKVCSLLEAGKTFQRLRERLLHQVFGFVIVVREPAGEVIQRLEQRRRQLLE